MYVIISSVELALRNDGWGDGEMNELMNENPWAGDRNMNEPHFTVLVWCGRSVNKEITLL